MVQMLLYHPLLYRMLYRSNSRRCALLVIWDVCQRNAPSFCLGDCGKNGNTSWWFCEGLVGFFVCVFFFFVGWFLFCFRNVKEYYADALKLYTWSYF